MPRLGRRGTRAERPGPVQEVAVDGADPRLAARGHGRQREHAHAGEQRDEVVGGEPPVTVDDRAQVVGRLRVRAVQQVLQTGDLLGRLVHVREVTPVRRSPE